MQPQDNNSPETTPTTPVEPSSGPTPQVITPTVISPTVSTSPQPAATPAPIVTDSSTPPSTPDPVTSAEPLTPQPVVTGSKKPKRLKKFLIIIVVLLLLLGGGAAAFYFGYYANPSLVYKQTLSNTAVGYDRLVKYVDEQSAQTNYGYTGTGSYSLDSESFDSKGKMTIKADETNSETTLDIGLGPNTLKADIITITGKKSASPDVYLKLDGLDDLSQLLGGLGETSAAPALNKLNNAWISVDHTLIDSLTQSAAGATTSDSPTKAQIVDEMKAFGKVNKEYLYSTDKEKAVLTLVKKYGVETVDGHKTYHYQVALNKANVKKYINAQRDALKASKLADWLEKNGYDESAYAYFDMLAKSADSIKPTNTFDMWSDLDERVVYKVRFSEKSNPASNYVDVGLDYKGGDEYPMFVTFQSKDGKESSTGSVKASLNTKSGNVGIKFNLKSSGSSSDSLTSEFNFKPSTSKITVTKPTGAIPIEQVIQQLGYGEMYKAYMMQLQQANAASSASPTTTAAIQAKAKDSERQTDIKALHAYIESYFAEKGKYPTLAEINDANWRKTNMKQLNDAALADPDSTSKVIVAKPVAKAYSYEVVGDKYTLTATLSDGTTFVKTSLN